MKKNVSPQTKVKRQMITLPHLARGSGGGHPKQIQKKHGEKERQIIAKIITRKVLKKYRFQYLAQNSLGISRKIWKNERNGKVNYTYQKKWNKRVPDSSISRVRAFYSSHDMSCITIGKRQTITWKKIKRQKWFLLDTMKNMRMKFWFGWRANLHLLLYVLIAPTLLGLFIQIWVIGTQACARYMRIWDLLCRSCTVWKWSALWNWMTLWKWNWQNI